MSDFIIGVDEVGRGYLVGSVIICAFRSKNALFDLLPFSVKDSKKINKKQILFLMKIQKYHLLFIIALFLLTSCGVTKKNGCNTCPNFSSIAN